MHSKMTCLKWKANRKEHTEEALFNFSSDNVYLLFGSFCASIKLLASLRL